MGRRRWGGGAFSLRKVVVVVFVGCLGPGFKSCWLLWVWVPRWLGYAGRSSLGGWVEAVAEQGWGCGL